MVKYDMRIFLTWNEFWTQLWDSIKIAWSNLGSFWFHGTETDGPYIANFLFAIALLILGWLLIKIILKIVRKTMNIKKGIVKEKTAKSFIVSTIGIALYFTLLIIVLLILRVDLSNASQIFATAVLAIGLALQNIIMNFACGILILINKPFVVGEYVNIGGEIEGTVVNVKFLLTTLLTVNEQVVTIQNSSVIQNTVTNYSRSPIRRLVADIHVDYSADIDQVKRILVEVAKQENRVLVENGISAVVTDFGNDYINVSLRVFTPTSEYWDVRFDLFEKIALELKKNNVKVAFNQVVVSNRQDKNSGGTN